MNRKKELLLAALRTDDTILSSAIVHIYKNQTSLEQEMHVTEEDNGIGFNGTDAKFGSSLAERIISGRALTDAQKDGVSGGGGSRKMMKKYAGQLIATGFQWKEEEDIQSDITRFDEACQNLLGESGATILEILLLSIEDGNDVEFVSVNLDISTESLNELHSKIKKIQVGL